MFISLCFDYFTEDDDAHRDEQAERRQNALENRPETYFDEKIDIPESENVSTLIHCLKTMKISLFGKNIYCELCSVR